MKRLSSILLSVFMCALLIVSCEPQKSVDEVVDVKVEITNKDDLSNCYWRYTAVKTDSTGFTTGEKREETQFDTNNKLSLSTGEWKISLFGYEDDSYTNLLYKGELSTTVTKETNSVNVDVTKEKKYIASVNSVLFESIEEALKVASNENPLSLTNNTSLLSYTFSTKSVTIDLNGNTLCISEINYPESDNEYTVTIKNGTITGSGSIAFTQKTNSHLILDNVNVNYEGLALTFLYQGSNPVWLDVKNSTLNNKGGYGIGTNASEGTDYVYVTIDNSSVTTTSSDEDNTAVLFNVPGELKISNSTISGERQGLIVRGGNATISNSTIEARGTKSTYSDWLGKSDYNNNNWGAGNRVPLAALIVGNASKNAYKYSTNVEFDGNVVLKASDYRDDIYKAEVDGYPVTITGTYTTEGGRKHITSLEEAFIVDFGYNKDKTTASDITIDGEGKYVVDKWQDLWFSGNVTIKGVEFSKGITLSVNNGETVKSESTITVEDCVIYGCNQEELTDEMRNSANNSNYNNAGNGLGLSINGNDNENFINVKVSNCYFVGDGDTTKPRKDSYPSIGEYDSKSNAKGRSNGIGLGTTTGNGKSFKSVDISTSYFTNHRNASIQLYTFTNDVNITDCIFNSWGVNSEDTKDPSFAIRGESPNENSVKLTIKGCEFNNKNKNICSVDNVTPTITK